MISAWLRAAFEVTFTWPLRCPLRQRPRCRRYPSCAWHAERLQTSSHRTRACRRTAHERFFPRPAGTAQAVQAHRADCADGSARALPGHRHAASPAAGPSRTATSEPNPVPTPRRTSVRPHGTCVGRRSVRTTSCGRQLNISRLGRTRPDPVRSAQSLPSEQGGGSCWCRIGTPAHDASFVQDFLNPHVTAWTAPRDGRIPVIRPTAMMPQIDVLCPTFSSDDTAAPTATWAAREPATGRRMARCRQPDAFKGPSWCRVDRPLVGYAPHRRTHHAAPHEYRAVRRKTVRSDLYKSATIQHLRCGRRCRLFSTRCRQAAAELCPATRRYVDRPCSQCGSARPGRHPHRRDSVPWLRRGIVFNLRH